MRMRECLRFRVMRSCKSLRGNTCSCRVKKVIHRLAHAREFLQVSNNGTTSEASPVVIVPASRLPLIQGSGRRHMQEPGTNIHHQRCIRLRSAHLLLHFSSLQIDIRAHAHIQETGYCTNNLCCQACFAASMPSA